MQVRGHQCWRGAGGCISTVLLTSKRIHFSTGHHQGIVATKHLWIMLGAPAIHLPPRLLIRLIILCTAHPLLCHCILPPPIDPRRTFHATSASTSVVRGTPPIHLSQRLVTRSQGDIQRVTCHFTRLRCGQNCIEQGCHWNSCHQCQTQAPLCNHKT